ncbi:hypothetical protein KSS87_011564 [Heliosperma pusillum]|nr:hypothetical protein KSS87_011564 [Heliosperma pusillum]
MSLTASLTTSYDADADDNEPSRMTSTTTDTFPTTITTASSPLTLPSTCRCCLSNRNISITLVQLNGGTKETTGRSLTKDCIIING